MLTPDACLKLINQIRESYSNYETAYVARFRLRRLISNCSELVTELSSGSYDGALSAEPAQRLSSANSELHDLAQSVCQASEPLDNRWRDEWDRIMRLLDELEKQLSRVVDSV